MSHADRSPAPPAPTGEALSLEARMDALAATVSRLEARITRLEAGTAPGQALVAPPVATPPFPAPEAPEALPSPVRLLGLIGRTCLILGGATFIRALVDAGTLHRGLGVAVGLAYGLLWALLATRARQRQDASFHALASVLIAYPLLVESTARFQILPVGLAALLLLGVALAHTWMAWRRDLQGILWVATLAGLGSAFALMASRQALEPFLAVILALGIGTLWLTYGRRWHGLRWPTALGADLGTLVLTSLAAWPGGPPEAYRSLSATAAVLFGLALAAFYLGSFALRMLTRRRMVNAFEITQSILVLLVGFGGALRVTLATGSGGGALGAGITLAGLGCYGTALRFGRDESDVRANFQFFTTLALVFLLTGGAVLLPAQTFGPAMGLLGLVVVGAGLRLGRRVLILQGAFYLAAAAVGSGLAGWTAQAFLRPAGLATPLTLGLGLSLLALWGALLLVLTRDLDALLTASLRPAILILGALAATGVGALAIQLCCYGRSTPDAGLLAAVRTAVLSGLAIALAAVARKRPQLELRWLVYPLMVVTALKFLFEDLAVGRPLTLFLGFMAFGATLMLAPRLVKPPTPPPGGPNPSHEEVDP